MSDLISRQAALDIYDDYNVAVENGELEAYGKHRERLLELPSAQPERDDCDTCKYHGYFGSVVCNNCRMRYPSYWESREGGQE